MKKMILLAAVIAIAALSSFTFERGLFDTGLRITVLDELGNRVEGATIKLYESDKDYRASENEVAEAQITDEKGRVTFKDLESKVYFIDARKGNKNNNGAGVQTDKLEEKKLNKVNIVIE